MTSTSQDGIEAAKVTAELPPFNLRLLATMTENSKDCQCCKLTVPQSDTAHLIPCGCTFCKDCMMEFLFKTRLEPYLKCCSCGQAVTSVHAEEPSTNQPAEGALDTKPGPDTPLRQGEDHVQHSSSELEVEEVKNEKKETNIIDDTKDESKTKSSTLPDSFAKSAKDSNVKQTITKEKRTEDTEDGCAEGSKDSKQTAKIAEDSNAEDDKPATKSAEESNAKDSKPAAKTKAAKKRKQAPKTAKKRKPAQKRKPAGEGDGTPKEKKPKVRKRKITLDEKGNPKYPKLLLPRPRKTFEERMADLLEYKRKFGHVAVPVRYAENPALGKWVRNVRGGIKKITMQERKRLSDAGFVWETKSNRFGREWREQFERLKTFKRRFGDCFVPWNWSEDKVLSEWVHTQRKLNNKGQLKEDRKKELESIGFAWRGRGSAQSAAKKKAANNVDNTRWEDVLQGFPDGTFL